MTDKGVSTEAEAVERLAKASFRRCAEWVGSDAKNASWSKGNPAGREYWCGLVAPLLAKPSQMNPMGFVYAALRKQFQEELIEALQREVASAEEEGRLAMGEGAGPTAGSKRVQEARLTLARVRAALSTLSEEQEDDRG